MTVARPLPADSPNGKLLTARDMTAMLRRHYLPDDTRPAGIFAPEIQAPGPTQRRADLIWLGCTVAAGSHLIGHEIKVTRTDLLVELADLTKSDPWQRYCDRWWLVIPSVALIEGLEIPESWGVLTPPSGRRTRSMTVWRPAPELRPAEQAPALRTLAAWVGWQLRDQHNRAADYERRYTEAWRENQQLQITAAAHSERPNPFRDVVTRIVRELGGPRTAHPDEIGSWEQGVKIDDVIAALKDLGAVYKRRDEALRVLEHAEGQLENAGRSIARALGEIRAAATTTDG